MRISRTEDRLGVDRQLDICRLQLAAMGVDEDDIELFDENDSTATKGLEYRPEYVRLMGQIAAGKIAGIMVFLQDRGWRDTDELSVFLKLGVRLATSSTGELDLTDPDTYANVKINTVNAEREIRLISKRVKAASKQRAERGGVHGRAPFGWRREVELSGGRIVRRWDELVEEEASVIRYAADQLLRGKSMRAVIGELNQAGTLPRPVVYKRGRYKKSPLITRQQWTSDRLRKVLLRESNAGLRIHQGKELPGVVADAPAILDVETFRRVQSLLRDPARQTREGGSTIRFLLSGIATCDQCGVTVAGYDETKRRPSSRPVYRCPGRPGEWAACRGQRHYVDDVDDYVAGLVAERISDPAFAEADPEAQRKIDERHAEIDRQRRRLAEAQEAYVDELLSIGKLKEIKASVSDRIAECETEISDLRPHALGFPLVGGEFALLDLAAKRAVVRQLFESIVLTPSPLGIKRTRADVDQEVSYSFRGGRS